MNLPNFLIIGAAKAGTTSLYAWLKQHSQIYMTPVKETNFFALEGEKLEFPAGTITENYLAECKTTIEAYREQFQGVASEIAIGEASPMYLYDPKAADRIKHYIPNVKLIAILRNPIERAYSNFLHHRRDGVEAIADFNEAIREEENRIRNNWWWGFHYTNVGFYYAQLERYFDRFDPSQIKVYLYEELKTDSTSLLQDIYQFLGVDDISVDTSTKYNVTGIPRNKLWSELFDERNLMKLPRGIKAPLKLLFPLEVRKKIVLNLNNRNLAKPELPKMVKKQLIEVYREDVLKLQEAIGRDLSGWLE